MSSATTAPGPAKAQPEDPATDSPRHGPEAAQQAQQPSALPPSPQPARTAFCDRCMKPIDGIRYKCQQCPDFDYCLNCVIRASSIHPGHEFVPFKGKEPLSEEELVEHGRVVGQESLDPTTFRLLGHDTHVPVSLCTSCQPVTMPLPAVDVILQDQNLRQQMQNGLQLRWPARISKLVEATVGGCAFCSLILHKFFGDSPLFQRLCHF